MKHKWNLIFVFLLIAIFVSSCSAEKDNEKVQEPQLVQVSSLKGDFPSWALGSWKSNNHEIEITNLDFKRFGVTYEGEISALNSSVANGASTAYECRESKVDSYEYRCLTKELDGTDAFSLRINIKRISEDSISVIFEYTDCKKNADNPGEYTERFEETFTAEK